MGQQYSVITRVAKAVAFLAMTACGLAAMSPAFAGPVISADKDTFVWMGLYGRYDFNMQENGAEEGAWSKQFNMEEGRRLLYGKAMKIGDKGELAFEWDVGSNSVNTIRTLDVYTQFDFNDLIRIWVGRFVPPSDRASMEAPAYTMAFDYPIMSAWQIAFNNIRDNNVALWGQVQGGQYKYYVAASNGRRGGPNANDDLTYSLRFSADFLDPEPGYYPSSSYDGAKKIANVGLTYKYQHHGAGTAPIAGVANAADFKEFSIDYRYEAPDNIFNGGGIIDSEGGWYNYDLNHKTDDSGFLVQGHGYFIELGYAFPQKFGIGKIEPVVEWQQFYRANSNAAGLQGKQQRFDAGFQYLIKGHDIRIDTFYYHMQQGPDGVQPSVSTNGMKVLFQFYW
jgi:hypothetical protein